MLRWVGGFMILAGSLGLGMWYRNQFRLRLKLLRQLSGMLDMLMSEIRYGKATLPECCGSVGKKVSEPFAGALLRVAEKMKDNTGEEFGDVFNCFLGEAMKDLPLEEEDKEIFFKFAGRKSFSDSDMQIREMECGRDRLNHICAELDKTMEERGRLAVGLGAMSGLLLVIVLL